MNRNLNRQGERGISMIIALLALLALSTLGAAIIFLTQTEIWTATNYRLTTQARYASEAGMQGALNWMIYNYSPPTTTAQFANFDMTKSPVEYLAAPIVLSAMSGYSANYPTTSMQTAFNSSLNNRAVSGMGIPAKYNVKATLSEMKVLNGLGNIPVAVQTWRVTSRGSLSGARPAQVELTADFDTPVSSIFAWGAFGTDPGCRSVEFS